MERIKYLKRAANRGYFDAVTWQGVEGFGMGRFSFSSADVAKRYNGKCGIYNSFRSVVPLEDAPALTAKAQEMGLGVEVVEQHKTTTHLMFTIPPA
jgi:hypothetical protein